MERKWKSVGTPEGSLIALKFQVQPPTFGDAQLVGPSVNVVIVMPLWVTGKGAPAPGKVLVLKV
jgi:hypothetical protein